MDPKLAVYRDLAHRLLEREGSPGERLADPAAGQRVCARLQDGLIKLVGPAGFMALWQRALYLARPASPLLEAVPSASGTCLDGLAERAVGHDPGEVSEALINVFGQFLWLLSTFIGDELVRRQIRRIWPELSLDTSDSQESRTSGSQNSREAATGMEEAVQ